MPPSLTVAICFYKVSLSNKPSPCPAIAKTFMHIANATMFLLWILSWSICGRAAPTPSPKSSAEYISFESQPNNRGTYDILLSCIITMTLCVWTALHLNIPTEKNVLATRSRWTRLWYHNIVRKARWVLMGLFAPELVVYNAWMQRRQAVRITLWARDRQILAEALGISQPFEWTIYHSWYMLMGGFYFETHDQTLPDFLPGSPNLILTTDTMLLLIKTCPPLLPEMSKSAIKDHSKADVLAKSLAALQIMYLFMSCTSRLGKGLPISQLEVNTFGHILCAFAIMFLWFKKPKDVKVRTPIRTPWSRPLCAYLWMCSTLSCRHNSHSPEIVDLFPRLAPEAESLPPPPISLVESAVDDQETEGDTETTQPETKNSQEIFTPCSDDSSSLGDGRTWPVIDIREKYSVTRRQCSNESSQGEPWSWTRDISIDPMVQTDDFAKLASASFRSAFLPARVEYSDAQHLLRVRLALKYFDYWSRHAVTHTSQAEPKTTKLGVHGFDNWVTPPFPEATLLTDTCSDWLREPRARVWYAGVVTPSIVIALLTMSYGALHGAVWHSHFPTETEAQLWRISAVLIASSGFLVAAERTLTGISSRLTDAIVHRSLGAGNPWQDYRFRTPLWMPKMTKKVLAPFLLFRQSILDSINRISADKVENIPKTNLMTMVVLCLCLGVFMTARLYIVLEAFLSLRSVPIEMYQTPNWPGWFPHL